MLNAIHFIEEQTGEKFDWDAFLISLESFNNFYVAVRWTVAYNK